MGKFIYRKSLKNAEHTPGAILVYFSYESKSHERERTLFMKPTQYMLHIFLEIGEVLLSSGGEVFRVEDTLRRLGYAYGAEKMNVFVITSSIIITMEFPNGEIETQTRRISRKLGNNFIQFEEINALSRRVCHTPISLEELEKAVHKIKKYQPSDGMVLLGSILGTISFTLFFGGTLYDGIFAGITGVLIWALQKYIAPICLNNVIFNFIAAFVSGWFICVFADAFPMVHRDMVMIGDIMLLIPGLIITNAIRDILVGDTISGIMRFIEAMIIAGVLALGFMSAIWVVRRLS